MIKSVLLPLSPAAAFALFTESIGEWWPADRRHTGDSQSEIFLLESGRFFERARDGNEVELGLVRSWLPPSRIVFDFFVATGTERPTEVEISFAPEAVGTRVTVHHRPKPESEDLWDQRAPGYGRSWDLVLAALRGAAVSRPVRASDF
jgi:uncharacterized protein YndB with AHSA1/START domain